MIVLRALALLLFAGLFAVALIQPAHAAPAQTLTYSWMLPTTRADGSALLATDIASINVYYAVDGGAEQKVNVTPGAATSKVISLALAPRVTPYSIISAATVVDSYGQESSRSASITTKVTVLPAFPNTVGNFTMTVTCANGSCSLIVQ